MKSSALVVLSVLLSACDSPEPRQSFQAASEPVVSSPAPSEDTTPAPVVQQAPAPQEPNIVTQEPNTAIQETNPNHLKVDPVTGKYDFRYGLWTVGLKTPTLPSDLPCGGLHGAALGFQTESGGYSIVGNAVTVSADGCFAWTWENGDTEVLRPDGTGAYVFTQQNVTCILQVAP
jgi:hypothetical protein